MARAERELIVRALQQFGNNQTEAARQLGVTRDILRHRMKKYGLLKPKSRSGLR
jgi:DNA-binding NtrC family response regulator